MKIASPIPQKEPACNVLKDTGYTEANAQKLVSSARPTASRMVYVPTATLASSLKTESVLEIDAILTN